MIEIKDTNGVTRLINPDNVCQIAPVINHLGKSTKLELITGYMHTNESVEELRERIYDYYREQ